MAARREADVLLTEGHDGAFALPGPDNSAFGVFGGLGNRTKIGYGGWQGNAQQVATINADNSFTDFDEPMAETVIGWNGFTIQPVLALGDNFDLTGEYTSIDYNTNWQAWGDPSRGILRTPSIPTWSRMPASARSRNAYAPFQEKETDILVVKGKLFVDVGSGLELFGKVKFIDETDKRMNDPRFCRTQAGDCPGGGVALRRQHSTSTVSTRTATIGSPDLYGNPPVITVSGVTGYQWKPFDSLSRRRSRHGLHAVSDRRRLPAHLTRSTARSSSSTTTSTSKTATPPSRPTSCTRWRPATTPRTSSSCRPATTSAAPRSASTTSTTPATSRPSFGGGFVTQFADAGHRRQSVLVAGRLSGLQRAVSAAGTAC